MSVSQEELDRVAREGRRARRLSKRDRKRADLAKVVDTGLMSDADVDTLWDAYQGGKVDPQNGIVLP